MIVTVSSALLFAIITVVLVRSQRVSAGSAVLIWLSGFTIAGTGLAGPVNSALDSIAHYVATLH
ncbi:MULTISPECIES: hypothetical protein [Kitasatospora]|uniref:hypothetical protein n=1 Tax=Kitasatospora TaxID=2063 RepID=UPI001D968840|nr:hypothetical protein [Kitasatospora aureofaciens]BFD92062.1 hypothetical protein KitaXyl93_34220 [Kitasatospora sp. Xyl93]HJD84161.1 hypothetical protein [Kitasatospora aureofaciens]